MKGTSIQEPVASVSFNWIDAKGTERPLTGIIGKPYQVAAGEWAWRTFPLPGAPPLTRLALWLSSVESTVDDSRARAELGYAPVITREQGLTELAGPR